MATLNRKSMIQTTTDYISDDGKSVEIAKGAGGIIAFYNSTVVDVGGKFAADYAVDVLVGNKFRRIHLTSNQFEVEYSAPYDALEWYSAEIERAQLDLRSAQERIDCWTRNRESLVNYMLRDS